MNKRDEKRECWQFVAEAATDNEANIIEAILAAEEIPVVKKYKEFGEYLMIYTGMTNLGVEIYVPESMAEKAREILEASEYQE